MNHGDDPDNRGARGVVRLPSGDGEDRLTSGTARIGSATSGRAAVSGTAALPGRASVPRRAAASGTASVPGRAQGSDRTRSAVGRGGSAGPAGGPAGRRVVSPAKLRARKIRRRRIMGIFTAMALLLSLAGCGATYAVLQVPLPDDRDAPQTSIIYFADGKHELGRLSEENRQEIPCDKIPQGMKDAVVSAEDRSFYSNSGVSITGIARAVWANIRGKELQGGSTITQQYVKNAKLSQERTFSRKMKEIVYAVKMDQDYSKDDILCFYLNTIAFGRGANGAQAAAKVYFNTTIDKLNTSQFALLAEVIKAPSYYDPAKHPQEAQDRWKYVIDGMVTIGKLSSEEAAKAKFPDPKTLSKYKGGNGSSGLDGWQGLVMDQVVQELESKGFTDAEIRGGGLRIVTTLDYNAQNKAVAAAKEVLTEDGAPGLGTALVAVQPGDGAVRAYYGGENGYGGFDLADAPHPPGSSFKAYVLAQALSDGVSYDSHWNGSSPRTFPDRPDKPVFNSENTQCPDCTLRDATIKSLNTVYYAVTDKIGADKVAALAKKSGIRTLDGKPVDEMISQKKLTNNLGVGSFAVSVLDQADGFATFAAKGTHAAPYFVVSVSRMIDGKPKPDYKVQKQANRAFSEDVAADATYVMQGVVSSKLKLADDRQAAGKTGTQQFGAATQNENAHAWMCGYTPQLAAAVWVGTKEGADKAIKTSAGKNVFGSGLPGQIWRKFMNGALGGQKNQDFANPAHVGDDTAGDAVKATPSPQPSPDAQNSPSVAPSPSAPTTDPNPRPSRKRSKSPFPTGSVDPSSSPSASTSPTGRTRRPGFSFPPLG
jgi:membrane peptidoglycan carboxypeptidase